MKMVRIIKCAILAFLLSLLPGLATAAVCPRPVSGSVVIPPPDLFTSNGVLNVTLDYEITQTLNGQAIFCFQTPDGTESPTLHAHPGDTINLTLSNAAPSAPGAPSQIVSNDSNRCGANRMTVTSINLHFHGLNVSPKCHGDEVIHTMVNSGQTFLYKLKIPADEPPGLYWYHPHIHGMASQTVQGGATGAIVVEGIENIQPAVAGLPQRLLVLRDQLLPTGDPAARTKKPGKPPTPNWDVSVNYVPVYYPKYKPAIIKMAGGTTEFWRVANTAANTIMDLQVVYDSVPQTLQVVGLDGVPTGSQDGTAQGTILPRTHLLLPPAGRAEFILAAPPSTTKVALLQTQAIDGGPSSDSNPARPLARIVLTKAAVHLPRTPERSGPPNKQRFANLATAQVTAHRLLYFSEVPTHGVKTPDEGVNFYITVEGQQQKLFDPNNPPAVTTTRGAVEDWVIQNRTFEVHEFHMHQIHFLLLEQNGMPVPKEDQQFYDTYQVGYWTGRGRYPSIKVRMDFRGAVVGDFVYHCHILEHEDGGMMGIIRVLPKKA
jgi:FtsP/CotA-like multicopper oxidase with cupredoxin domain